MYMSFLMPEWLLLRRNRVRPHLWLHFHRARFKKKGHLHSQLYDKFFWVFAKTKTGDHLPLAVVRVYRAWQVAALLAPS